MQSITSFYLVLSMTLFVIGSLGVLLRQNVLIMLMSIELMLNAANLALVAFSDHFGTMDGQVYALFVMAVAAAEAAVGLAITIAVFRNIASIESSKASVLRG